MPTTEHIKTINQLIDQVKEIEREAQALFSIMQLTSLPYKLEDQIIFVISWAPTDAQREACRILREHYAEFFHAGLAFVKAYIPYETGNFSKVFPTMESYLTLSRQVQGEPEVIESARAGYQREFKIVIDTQINILRSIINLPTIERSVAAVRCFRTGSACHIVPQRDPSLVFVIMPFSEEYDDIYKLGIQETIRNFGLVCMRSDEIIHSKDVLCVGICQQIRNSRFMVADLTRMSANVFYELGIAHALEKDVILITQSMDHVPFDLRNLNVIVYRNIGELRSKMEIAVNYFMENGTEENTDIPDIVKRLGR